jgi:hypothetical protein
MPRTYRTETCWGHPDRLDQLVGAIGSDGGRIVSVMWHPDRTIKNGAKPLALESVYVVLVEDDADA